MRKERPQLPDVKIWQLKDIGEVVRGPVPESCPRTVRDGLLVGLLEAGTVRAYIEEEVIFCEKDRSSSGSPMKR
jgi:hypothetical protein